MAGSAERGRWAGQAPASGWACPRTPAGSPDAPGRRRGCRRGRGGPGRGPHRQLARGRHRRGRGRRGRRRDAERHPPRQHPAREHDLPARMPEGQMGQQTRGFGILQLAGIGMGELGERRWDRGCWVGRHGRPSGSSGGENRMILGIRARIPLFATMPRTRQTHRTPEPWPKNRRKLRWRIGLPPVGRTPWLCGQG
jgi:hypothetical protein